MGAREDFFIVVQVLGHGDQVVLSCIALADETFLSCPRQAHIPGYQRDRDPAKEKKGGSRGQHRSPSNDGGKKAHDIGRRRHSPVLVTAFRQALDDIRFIAHQS